MTQSASADLQGIVEGIQALGTRRAALEERLRRLEAGKGTTAATIYERVHAETRQALQQLAAEEHEHRTKVSQLDAQLAQRRQELSHDLQRLSEELEEVRFRKTLGEYTGPEFQRIEAEKLTAVSVAQADLEQLDQVRGLMAPFLGTTGSVAAPQAPPPHAPAPVARPLVDAGAEPTEPSLPRRSAPGAPARVAPPPISEMEALFGSAAPMPSAPPPAPYPSAATAGFPGLGASSPASSAPSAAPPQFPTQAGFRPVLIVRAKEQDRGEDSYDLAVGQTYIGRAPENDIILLEESVSRRHARVSIEGTEASFEDLGSANGSFINGDRMRPREPRKLRDNDVLKLGQLLALYRVNPDD